MAVTVKLAPIVTLDAADRIVGVGPAAGASSAHSSGR